MPLSADFFRQVNMQNPLEFYHRFHKRADPLIPDLRVHFYSCEDSFSLKEAGNSNVFFYNFN